MIWIFLGLTVLFLVLARVAALRYWDSCDLLIALGTVCLLLTAAISIKMSFNSISYKEFEAKREAI